MKVEFAEGGKPEYPEKNPVCVRLRSTNLSPRAEPRTRCRVVEVGGATYYHYANLPPLACACAYLLFISVNQAERFLYSLPKKTKTKNDVKLSLRSTSSFLCSWLPISKSYRLHLTNLTLRLNESIYTLSGNAKKSITKDQAVCANVFN